MQFKALIFAAVASVAVAQTTTTSSLRSSSTSSCAAQNILDSCIGTIQGQINACAYADYSCLCTQYENMLTCYNNCPADPGVGTVQQQRELNCNNAEVYGTTTTLGTAPATTASSATATGTNTDVENGFGSGTSTGSGSSSTSSSDSSNGAGALAVSGLSAIIAAGLALL